MRTIGTKKINEALFLGSLTSDPDSPENGQIWYRSDLGAFRLRQDGDTGTIALIADIAELARLSAVENLADNTVDWDASIAAWQRVTLESGTRNITYTGFSSTVRQALFEIDVSDGPDIVYGDGQFMTEVPIIAGNDKIFIVAMSPDEGTTVYLFWVGEEAASA